RAGRARRVRRTSERAPRRRSGMPSRLDRIARMDAPEIAWRGRTLARSIVERAAPAPREPRWDRTRLRPARARHREVAARGPAALREYRWLDAHRALSNHLAHGGSQFVIRPADRRDIVARIRRRFPSAADDAAQRAERLLAGHHDLLGYRDLDFRGPDWHYDP